jgi:hypothetical protein
MPNQPFSNELEIASIMPASSKGESYLVRKKPPWRNNKKYIKIFVSPKWGSSSSVEQ